MSINWFPGHMHKARKEIAEMMPQVDLIIEVLDARIPYSSENPLVPALRGDTPVIKILNKSDLADPKVTEQWLTYLEQEKGIKAIALTQDNQAQIKDLLNLCPKIVPHRDAQDKQIRTLICGIPNVGKSTLINTLAGRIIAKTGNEAGVTKSQQRIRLENNIVLHDTPGFLWPKLEPEECGYRLAVTGAVKDTVTEIDDIAFFAAEYFIPNYQKELIARFNLDEEVHSEIELMDAIAEKRGCLRKGGIADIHKVSEILINEFRVGTIGRLSLETPEMVQKEIALLEEKKAIELEKNGGEEKPKKKKKRRRR